MNNKTENEKLKSCLPLVIQWYAQNGRPLPWRQEPSPYHVWLSEIMLQQTRIEAVIPYYRRFLRELPTVEALAGVEDERLMKLWGGLGYYSRARNLKKAAQQLVACYGGELPQQAEELKKLPGIGDYTAGAIASIAYGQPEPAVDGNVLRVMTRLLADDGDIMQADTKGRITALLRQSYPAGKDAALLTEGLMELGETLCIPKGAPNCAMCPLREHCLAHQRGTEERYPVKSPPKARRVEERTVFLLCNKGRYAIRRRPERGLLAGLWEFPNVEGKLSAEEAAARAESLGLRVNSCVPCAAHTHVFTHVEWHMGAYLLECAGEGGELLWKGTEEIAREYSLPTAFRFYLKLLTDRTGEEKRA